MRTKHSVRYRQLNAKNGKIIKKKIEKATITTNRNKQKNKTNQEKIIGINQK